MNTIRFKKSSIISRHHSTGLTLIELMISMVIGLLVLLALSTVFINTSRTNAELVKTNEIIENGRFALQLIQNDLMHAGFWGEYVPLFDNLSFAETPPADQIPATVPNACSTWPTADPSNQADLRVQWTSIPVQAYDAQPPGCTLTNLRPNTDVLLVRHAETCVADAAGCDPLTNGRLYFQASQCTTDPSSFQLSMLADASAPAASGFNLRQARCDIPAGMRRLSSNIYFVRDDGTAPPTLMRTRYDGSTPPPEPLIDGIEGFRIELGIDNISATGAAVNPAEAINWDTTSITTPTNRGDGTPDIYVRCTAATPCTAAQLINTTVVKVFILARSSTPTPGYTDPKRYCLATQNDPGICPSGFITPDDSFKRHLFVTTVRLNNVSGRRFSPP